MRQSPQIWAFLNTQCQFLPWWVLGAVPGTWDQPPQVIKTGKLSLILLSSAEVLLHPDTPPWEPWGWCLGFCVLIFPCLRLAWRQLSNATALHVCLSPIKTLDLLGNKPCWFVYLYHLAQLLRSRETAPCSLVLDGFRSWVHHILIRGLWASKLTSLYSNFLTY